jgi:glyoxylase-like metal-dependent hydrolase (beta-lactamase superfamily II)
VVEADGLRILVDTCIGNRPVPAGSSVPQRPASPFIDHLEAAGFPPESFDIVLCTHLHFDHVGWNTRLVDGSWVPTFPNARYLFGRIEWEHWSSSTGAEHYAAADEHAVRPLVENGHVDLVEAGHSVCESIWLEPTPGHTPGHVAVRISSQGQQALITGDLSHHPVQWAEPDWSVVPDVDPIESAVTRRRLISEHLDGDILILGTHYPPPTAGHLVTTPDGVRFRPQPQ